MIINEKLIVAFYYEGVEYVAEINAKQNEILFEDESWEADVDCDKTQKDYGYPYLTIWGIADKKGFPTTEGLHGLLNFENYDERICNKDFRIVQCS
jgi:ribosomal protein S6E (S10)